MKVVKPRRKGPKPWWLKLIYVFAIIALIVLTLNVIVSYIATKKMRSAAEASSSGLAIDFNYVRVNILNRSVKVSGVNIKPDTAVADFNINIDKVKLSGIGILKIFSGEGASIRKILIKEPVVKGNLDYLFSLKAEKKQDTIEKQGEEFSISIHRIILEDLQMDSVMIPSKLPFQDVSGLTMEIRDIILKATDDRIDYSVGDAELIVDDSRFLLPGEFYNIEFFKLDVSLSDSSVIIDSFRLIPNYGFYEFGRKKGIQTDRFVVGIDKLSLQGLDLEKAIRNEGIYARDLDLQKLFLKVFRDKRIPFDYNNFPPLPQQALNKLSFPVLIKHAEVSNTFVEYAEINDVSDSPGNVQVTDLSIDIDNLANRASNTEIEDITVSGEGKLYGSCEIVAEYIFPIYACNDTFFFNGTAENLEMSKMNQMVTPLTNMEITGGMLHKASFNGSANPVYSGGTFEMLYNDLSFEILKGNTRDEPEKPKGFLSFVAKRVVRSNNPIGNHDPKVVTMFFKRDINKGFFNFYWKTILSGIKFTALPGNQIKVQDEILPPKTNKQKRDAKKEARKERRELKRMKDEG